MEGMALNLIFCLSFYLADLDRTGITTDGIWCMMKANNTYLDLS